MFGEDNCNKTYDLTTISAISTATSGVICISTIILNVVILLALLNNKKLLQQQMFYRLLFNICVADLLSGFNTDVVSISFYLKQSFKLQISNVETTLIEIDLFLLNNVSILTMTLFSFDRIIALIKPFVYRNGIHMWKSILLLVFIWVVSILITIPVCTIGYVKYLGVFSFTTVASTTFSMVTVVIIYSRKFRVFPTPRYSVNRLVAAVQVNNTTAMQIGKFATITRKIGKNAVAKKRKEKEVNKSFIYMLLVFLFTYLPACGISIYLNTHQSCNYSIKYVLRDITYLSILSSSVWRPLIFILRLSRIRKFARKVLRQKQSVTLNGRPTVNTNK